MSAFALAVWLALQAMVQIGRRLREGDLPPALSLDAAVTLDHGDGSASLTCEMHEEPLGRNPEEGIPIDGFLKITQTSGGEQITARYHGSATVTPGAESYQISATVWRGLTDDS